MDVVILTGDLVVQSKVAAAAEMLGIQSRVAMSLSKAIADAAEDPPRLVVIDLNLRGCEPANVVEQFGATSVIAFGPHVAEDRLRAANDAGCAGVFSRGEFLMQTTAVLRQFLPK